MNYDSATNVTNKMMFDEAAKDATSAAKEIKRTLINIIWRHYGI